MGRRRVRNSAISRTGDQAKIQAKKRGCCVSLNFHVSVLVHAWGENIAAAVVATKFPLVADRQVLLTNAIMKGAIRFVGPASRILSCAADHLSRCSRGP
jgi:hypothetical protein